MHEAKGLKEKGRAGCDWLRRHLAPFLDESEKDLKRHGRLATAISMRWSPLM
jgi:hypothetical protein